MSTYFSKVIKAGERLREFNFRQVLSGAEPKYNVDVPDDKGNRVMFSMYKNEESQWRTGAQLLPVWVHDAETALAEAIEENFANEVKRKSK
jgi:hypothetical protein